MQPSQFMFPGTLAQFMREHSYMGEVAIQNVVIAPRHSDPWDIFTSRGNFHVHPVPGGFHVRKSPINPGGWAHDV